MIILIFGRTEVGVSGGGLPAVPLAAGGGVGFGEAVMIGGWGFTTTGLGAGEGAGEGFVPDCVPVGNGLRAGFGVLPSLEPAGDGSFDEALGAAPGKAVRTVETGVGGFPRMMASRCGFAVFNVTMRLRFHEPAAPD